MSAACVSVDFSRRV